jgi:hypothetical protein
MGRPISNGWCICGWFLATALFVCLVLAFGGPTRFDAGESVYSTLDIAHGQLSCAFVQAKSSNGPAIPIAPLYPLLSGGLAALLQVGSNVSIFHTAGLGNYCKAAFDGLSPWSIQGNAITVSLWIGCVGWLILMAGSVVWLRTSRHGRTLWEPAALVVLASLPPVWLCLESFYHPQDLMAMGLALASLACVRRDKWVGAGVLIALALLSQQFALLVAVPLVVVAPHRRRLRYVAAAVATVGGVSLFLLWSTSADQLWTVLKGSSVPTIDGNTVIGQLGLHGTVLILATRAIPLALSALIAFWAGRKLRRTVLEAAPLLALIAVSLCLRLVFEENLYGYYLLALAVSLLLLEATTGEVRQSVVAWLIAASLVFVLLPWNSLFWRISWAHVVPQVLPQAIAVATFGILLLKAVRRELVWTHWVWGAVAVIALAVWRGNSDQSTQIPIWFWQILLTASGLILGAGPLLRAVRQDDKPTAPTPSAASASG